MQRLTVPALCLMAGLMAWCVMPVRAADDHKEKLQDLGTKEVGGYSVKVQQESPVKAGAEAAFVVTVTKGEAKPKAVRAWVGIASAEGSAKAKGVAEGEELHCHVEVPKPIPDKSQFWVELDTASGKHKVAFDYK